ncbi:MAG: CpsD/CapB family tyrosine-protein kinase [Limnochordaceae bacterium]|nr:CpsD/CapB family tyrosine-protein kinase [Limnochordaceae bacterium]
MAEAFRTLRTNIQFASVDRPLRVMLVTSSGPDEGKSTVSANLSAALAQAGQRVLLINGDLRRPSLHRVLGCTDRIGLTNVLLGQASITEAVQETSVPNLYFLGSGPLPPNPAEVLGSQSMDQLLAQVKAAYDMVVVDMPPVVALADAAILAPRVDGVLLVVRAGRTNKEAARQAVAMLQRVRAHLLGVVLNDIDLKSSRYGYYYYYYYTEERSGAQQAAATTETAGEEIKSRTRHKKEERP